MKKILLSSLLLVLLFGVEAFSQNFAYKSKWGFGFGGSYVRLVASDAVGAENDFGGYLSIQRDFSESFGLRLRPFYRQTSQYDFTFSDGSNSVTFTPAVATMFGADLDFLYTLAPCEPVSPYFGAGFSYYSLKVENYQQFGILDHRDQFKQETGWTDSWTDYQVNMLLGVNWKLGKSWNIVTELGYHTVANTKIDGVQGKIGDGGILGGQNDAYMTFNLGLLVNFGKGEESRLCDLYNGIAPPPVDYDEIENRIIKHKPVIPTPEKVDYDRIKKMIDECCKKEAPPVQEVITLAGIRFDLDKFNVRPDAVPILNEAVTVLNKYPETRWQIQGHTCDLNTDKYNQVLSEKRAKSVLDYLVGKGINTTRLETKGMGELYPEVPNTSEANRKLNRRVVFTRLK